MNTKTLILVAFLAIVTVTSFVEGSPGDLGEPCYGWSVFTWSFGAVPLTHCSEKACDRAAVLYQTGCHSGLNCCLGNAPVTSTTSSTTTTTTTTTTTSTTTTTTTAASA